MIKRLTPGEIERVNDLECEIGKPMFRPKRFNAMGIHGVVIWAKDGRKRQSFEERRSCLCWTVWVWPMSRSQRIKGAAAEREAAALLSELLGRDVKRKLGAARDGGCDIDLDGFSVEVKRHEKTSPETWMAQATANANGRIPIVLYRVSRGQWRVIANLTDIAGWLGGKDGR